MRKDSHARQQQGHEGVSALKLFAVQLRVTGALVMREATGKYGHDSLGFFWVMGEPLLLTCGVMLMWTMAEGGGAFKQVGVVSMALTGYTMITLWRHLMGQSVRAISRASGLLYHRNIKILDILIARGMLETLALMTAFFVAYIPLALLGTIPLIRDPLVVIGAFFFQGLFSFSVALLTTSLTEVWEPGEKFVAPILYITLPFCGVFTMQAWVPADYRYVLSWSPLVNNVEMLRSAVVPDNGVTYYDVRYLVETCVVLLALGLSSVSVAKSHIKSV